MTLAAILDTKITLARRASSSGASAIRNACRVHARLAYAFGATRSARATDRHALRVEMNEALGYYPLMTLATEDVLQNALDVYGEEEAEKLKPYLDAACDHVARKWSGDGESFGVAVDWALENALAYAEDDGVTLTIPL